MRLVKNLMMSSICFAVEERTLFSRNAGLGTAALANSLTSTAPLICVAETMQLRKKLFQRMGQRPAMRAPAGKAQASPEA
jgi:hypothetical protein